MIVFGTWSLSGACGALGEQVRLDVAFDRTGTLLSTGVYESMLLNSLVSVGDTANDVAVRAFVSVTLGAIPAGANVTKVVLRLRGSVSFGNPFGDFVLLTADHVDVVTGIDQADFLRSIITSNVASLTSLPFFPAQENIELDVTEYVKADLAAGRPISTFRFMFNSAPTADAQFDSVSFEAYPADANMQPFGLATIAP
jgi:hypothetical protein